MPRTPKTDASPAPKKTPAAPRDPEGYNLVWTGYLSGMPLTEAAAAAEIEYETAKYWAKQDNWVDKRDTMLRGTQKQIEQHWAEVAAINDFIQTECGGIPPKELADTRSKVLSDIRQMLGAIELADELALMRSLGDYFEKTKGRYSPTFRKEFALFLRDGSAFRVRERQRQREAAKG